MLATWPKRASRANQKVMQKNASFRRAAALRSIVSHRQNSSDHVFNESCFLMAKVVIENLVKTYPDKNGPGATVVHGINLEIRDREFMVLVGPSGCGKSTTLRMIAGLEEISSGRISIDGKTVNDVPPKDRDIAMVFQNYALYPHMSVFENMAFGLKLRKLPKAEIESRVKEAAAMLGLGTYLDRKPKALSGGQRQRVAVGRAIVRKPKVFLFDEPLSNLDAKMRVSTRAEISKLHAQLGATMVYVTHDQVEAMTMGDRICVMKDGRIMQVAEPMELYNRPANLFVAGFIGSPAMSFVHGTVEREKDTLVFLENSADSPLRLILPPSRTGAFSEQIGKSVILGVRPEHVHLANETAGSYLRIDVVEPMGAETFLTLATAKHTLTARVDPQHRLAPGDTVAVSFDLEHAHFFDPANESRI
jgi:multiple sugar transport system ATP-binding protein